MSQSPKDDPQSAVRAVGCAVVIYLGVILGGLAIGALGAANYAETGQQDWPEFGWAASLAVIPLFYLIINWRYVFVLPPYSAPIKTILFVYGRTMSFVCFPFFTYLPGALVWWLSDSPMTGALTGLVIGWLITKLLQRTLFAHEYTNRDRA